MVQAEYARSRFVLKEALALAEQWQDRAAIAEATTYLGHATVTAGGGDEGRRLLQEAVRHWDALGDPHGLGESLFYLGYAADVMGDVPVAAAHYTAALDRLADAGNAQHAGFVHSYFSVLEWRRGNLSSAVAHIRALLQTTVSLRDRWLLSFAAQATVVLVGTRPSPPRGRASWGQRTPWARRPAVRRSVGSICLERSTWSGCGSSCGGSGVECSVSRGTDAVLCQSGRTGPDAARRNRARSRRPQDRARAQAELITRNRPRSTIAQLTNDLRGIQIDPVRRGVAGLAQLRHVHPCEG